MNGFCPEYISKVLIPVSILPGRAELRSSTSGSFDVPRTRTEFAKRAFSMGGPAAWNSLPQSLRQITDNGNSHALLRLIFTVLLTTFNCIFVFVC